MGQQYAELQTTTIHTNLWGLVPLRNLPIGVSMQPTLHHLILHSNVYRDINDKYLILQTTIASIKAVYILPCKSDLTK